MRIGIRRRSEQKPEPASESEELLFGGRLRYDTGWSQHEKAFLDLSLVGMARKLPSLVGGTIRLAWQADRGALITVGVCEIGQGIAQAVGLVVTNRILQALFAAGSTEERLRAALPSLVVAATVAVLNAVLASGSTAGTGRLEPKVERVATEQYLDRAARVELSAIEDAQFHRLLDSAQFGSQSARRMIGACVAALNGIFAFAAAAGVLTVLHPVLLPLLALIALPRSWGALRVSRRRYASLQMWIEHARAGRLIGSLLTDNSAAQEVRVHGVGPFLLGHFRTMSEASEAEQTRLADDKAGTELFAAALTGAASLATYAALAGLLLTGRMQFAVAGTAVLAIRTGSASLAALVMHVNRLYEEALFVADLEKLIAEADRRAIPVGGLGLPSRPKEIRFENVTFTYPGRDIPALDDVTLSIPAGAVVALVGENGSGKSTLAKLLAGLYHPDSGRIAWDGIDSAAADRDQLFSRIALVTQDFQRWPFTASTNITVGQPGAPTTNGRLQQAADYSGADSVIDALPNGLRTLLARQFQGGVELSGGQWQRFGIARARYRAAPVLICDEPTSALDPRAELETFDKIRGLAAHGQTVILVTHRLSSVRDADVIYVLHHGRLVEHGSHEELLARPGGRYQELFQMQAARYQASPVSYEPQ
ncbi:ABC transporter ATP-binding protein [Actinacidiphila oryziradicis]|uniref:ABC transporter ATP-binding protein n=1 Tax=Actinacidiphila oryziradicis TaxID=2571141 RepID=UPI0023EF660F|nr:ABC transporter ATP-binding protein [Actinacidiphila oryziradicis]MCW2870920.1 putative transporter protein [Actinacidiphila oryziradicis]